MLRLRKNLLFLIFGYVGLVLIMLPTIEFNITSIKYDLYSNIGITLLITSVMLFFYNKLNLKIDKSIETNLKYDKEGIREVNLIKLAEYFENIGKHNNSGRINVLIDYKYINKSIIEFFETFNALHRIKEIKILLTNYQEESLKEDICKDRFGYGRPLFIELLKEFKEGSNGKTKIRITGLAVFPFICITDEKVDLLIPYDIGMKKYINIITECYSETGKRYRNDFEIVWGKSTELMNY